MKIFLTGATGVMGRRAVPLLVKEGHTVTGVARTREKMQMLERLGAQPVRVDLFNPAEVLKVIEGHDAVCNLATSIPSGTRAMLPFAWRDNDRIRREVSRNLVDAALKVGTKHYVQESFALIYPDSGARWIDEKVQVKPARYVRSVMEAEGQAGRFTASGRTGVVLRFGLFYGPDSGHTLDMIKFTKKGVAAAFGSPDGYVSSLSTDDAAAAVVAAVSVPAGVYNVVDDEPVTKREYFDALADALGVQRPKFLPSWFKYLAGSMGETLARSHRMSNRLFKEKSGWSPRYKSVREGFPALVAQLMSSA
ncbi:MAG TPA: NAD(P)-dependent oxidoreductase [Pyrinomonadaceae bacterium]